MRYCSIFNVSNHINGNFKFWYFIFSVFLMVAWLRLSENQRVTVIRIWISTFGLLSIMGVFQFFTGWPRALSNPLLPGKFHPTLFLGHHLSVASIWIFPWFAALELFWKTRQLRRSGSLFDLGVSEGWLAAMDRDAKS